LRRDEMIPLFRSMRTTTLYFAVAIGSGCATADDYDGDSRIPAVSTGRVTGSVELSFGRRPVANKSGVVIVLQGVPGKRPDATAEVIEIRQIDKQFVPEVAVVLKGTTVTFPNDDRIDHNVYSDSRAARFNLGLYKAGTAKEVTLRRTGTVEIYCNVHSDMAARLLVVDTPYYAMTDAKGRFSIAGVPPGTYRYRAWQPWGAEKRGRVTVRAGESAELSLRMTRDKKPGGPYGPF
jgi:plastocyanin